MMLKKMAMLFSCVLRLMSGTAQEETTEAIHENVMENATNRLEELPMPDYPDHTGITRQENYSINRITHDELSHLGMLSVMQIHSFLWYRENFGPFISILELQTIPLWTPDIIRLLMPYMTKGTESDRLPELRQRWKEGTHMLVYRTGKADKIAGMNSISSPQLLLYRFRFRNLMQWGLTLESDAGEKRKPDHLSGFVQMAGKGKLKQFIAGDFIVNMGQGLIHWQGFTAGGTGLLNSFRQGELFKPHTGRDENRYHRGMALSLRHSKWELSVFGSYQPIDASLQWDSLSGHFRISSFPLSGLHRTEQEMAVRKKVHVGSAGSRLTFSAQHLKVSINALNVNLDIPVARRNLPYNLFKHKGKLYTNAGMEAIVFTKAGLLFAEWSVDRNLNAAMTTGWIKSINKQFDLSIHYRNFSAPYQSWQSDCFSQSGEAGNEKGFFLNMNFSPLPGHRIDAYSDVFSFPWLKALTDAPSHGSNAAVQYTWKASKKAECLIRWQQSVRWNNASNSERINTELERQSISRLRVHLAFIPSDWLHLRIRHELSIVNRGFNSAEKGSLSYMEFILKPALSPFSMSCRYLIFDAETYFSRIYAYERDIPSYQSIPAFYSQESRWYLVVQWKWKRSILLSGKCVTDFRNNLSSNDWRLQISWQFTGEQ